MIAALENKFIYFPAKYPEGNWNPRIHGLIVEDCYFTARDNVRLHGWYVPTKEARATLIWCHGNAGNITHRLDNIRRLQPLKINVFIFDYRGYGKSEGEPSEDGLYEDAIAAYDYVIKERGEVPNKIIFFGRSLGTAVAVDLATRRKCRALILESSFPSAAEMAKMIARFLPIHLLIKSEFDSISKIKTLRSPILFVHGTEDKTVPLSVGRELFEAANEPKWFYEIPDANHNDTYLVGGSAYFQQLDRFIARVLTDDMK